MIYAAAGSSDNNNREDMIQIAPSFLSANFAHLEREIEMINRSEADWLHYDVMDGSFVPNISFGFPVMASLRGVVKKPMDVHMMVVQPERWIERMRDHGARILTVHQEACHNLHRTVQQIHEAGMMAGVAINPATPVLMLEEIICDLELVLVMSVNPGFGGQKFIPSSLGKIRRLKELILNHGSKALIEVDGGVNLETGAQLKKAGADILVAGHSVFRSENPLQTIHDMKML